MAMHISAMLDAWIADAVSAMPAARILWLPRSSKHAIHQSAPHHADGRRPFPGR